MKTNVPTNTSVRSFGNPQAPPHWPKLHRVEIGCGSCAAPSSAWLTWEPQGFFICETILEEIAGRVGKSIEDLAILDGFARTFDVAGSQEIRELNMCKKDSALTLASA